MGVRSLDELLAELRNRRNAALILGAGVSVVNGIPCGYELPASFVRKEPRLFPDSMTGMCDGRVSAGVFINEFVHCFMTDLDIQEAFLDWLSGVPAMEGAPSVHHSVLAACWLDRIFSHLVTTNWDFLFEHQVDEIYQKAYLGDPFDPVRVEVGRGQICSIRADRLFFTEPLDADESYWSPRWRIVANRMDLPEIARWSRPVWKIHGSPFFLACPMCQGINRWQRLSRVRLGDECPDHPGCRLVPQILLWGQRIDEADIAVWAAVKARLARSDMIVVCGSSGGDAYIRATIEATANAWVVAPKPGLWDPHSVNYVEASAIDLAVALKALLPE